MRIAARRRDAWQIAGYELEAEVHRVRIDHDWFEVARFGQGDPIVLVPGLAGGWRLLAPLAARLARRYEVYVPSLRGDRFLSGSARIKEFGDHAEDLDAIIGQLGLERPAVFGVSFGGAIALELAVQRPNRLSSLIVYGAEPRFRVNLGATIARRVLERFPLPTDSRFLNQFFNLLQGNKPAPDDPWSDFVVERCWDTDQSVMARRIGLLETFDVTDRLWRIEVPTLILAGSRDVVVPRSRQRALASSIAGARFETLEGAGHIGFLTHRDEVMTHVRRLLRQPNHSPRGHDAF